MNEHEKAFNRVKEHLEQLEDYRVFDKRERFPYTTVEDLGTLQELIDKQEPMKPIKSEFNYSCKSCGASIVETHVDHNYCRICGQKIDWSNYNETK